MKEPIRRKRKESKNSVQLARYCLFDGDTYFGTYTAPEIAGMLGCARDTVFNLDSTGGRYKKRWLVDRLAEDEMNHQTDRILALADEWDYIRLMLIKGRR